MGGGNGKATAFVSGFNSNPGGRVVSQQSQKLQQCIMSIDSSKNVNELLELTIAR
jgi:hypothetical protein